MQYLFTAVAIVLVLMSVRLIIAGARRDPLRAYDFAPSFNYWMGGVLIVGAAAIGIMTWV